MTVHDVAIVGAGPIGIELAVALRGAGLDVLHVEGGRIGQTMFRWPPHTRWFSSTERIAIAGVPISSISQSKCTREEYLAYLRTVVDLFGLEVRTFERVVELRRDGDAFALATERLCGTRGGYRARRVALTTGGNSWPARLGIPGEELPHVRHALGDPHEHHGRRIVIVGGRNSAVEAALRCHHAGARVTLSYRGDAFPKGVKYWLRPEIEQLIESGRIDGRFQTVPVSIQPESMTLRGVDGGDAHEIPADVVLVQIGYTADMSLFEQCGVTLQGDRQVPVFDEQTMETDVPGLFVAGTAVAGTQRSGVRVFLENCHVHCQRIAAAITGAPPPPAPLPYPVPEA